MRQVTGPRSLDHEPRASKGAGLRYVLRKKLRITDQSFNPNLWGSIKAITPFIGDYVGLAADATTAYAVWTDNRDVNPTPTRPRTRIPTPTRRH